jgi:hypothetical protein
MKYIHLKTWPEYFWEVKRNKKTFEIRKNDRNYQVGDILILEEYNPEEQQYSGEWCSREVTYILDKQPFVPEGYVVMAIKPIPLGIS